MFGIAKLLVSSEALTFRLILGRAILGSATSTVAGVALVPL
ncbi:phage holin family protein [Paraburkholderia sp. ZP32-5]|nr:phage holin family protein [Paraburkholderia sp. ZP32-5]